ncbi:single-strand binding protein family-domain-containing protein [Sparassis latifolia]|uniref:Single-stranded DNA-binding protein rim1, mitochondrial n=1 Tax=Sparassis crispa TaxID=139825 RepID=A0A401GB18_9APHY|nr:Single-stranded DNA-binding protein rim1, mitochondrial [Sparassis crispa]GBE79364.1 Single-stranded DNA-binding protein rim1, mitochondrial [Sparassis crispa]
MFSLSNRVSAARASLRAFSTTPSRSADLAKLMLIGRLGKDPEVRTTKNNKEYVQYTVATTNYPPGPPNADGSRGDKTTTWHSVLSFNNSANAFLRTLKKGSQVFVEANFELREPDPSADPDTPQGQRQIFLRHESIRVLRSNRPQEEEGGAEEA